jgi:hypothetical protein
MAKAAAMIARKKRLIGACMGEDWQGAPGKSLELLLNLLLLVEGLKR